MNKRHHRSRWKDFFALSNRERRGYFLLLLLLCAEAVFLLWLRTHPAEAVDDAGFAAFRQTADAFLATLQDSAAVPVNGLTDAPPAAALTVQQPFDPNALTEEVCRSMGLRPALARTLARYVARGGRFRDKSDLKKIYGMQPSDYAALAPWVRIPPAATGHRATAPPAAAALRPVDIGVADTTGLQRIRGIGPVFARRIGRYRDRLGGFTSLAQLREVYGMNDTLYAAVAAQVCLADSTNVRRIFLNRAGEDELSAHPYIDRKLARLIVAFRQQHGSFQRMDELYRIPLVTDELYRKLAPYLSLE
jgi:competence protein ComEA